MLLPWRVLNGQHLATAHCAKGLERKRRQVAEEDMQDIAERSFQAYGRLLEMVTYFKYLGRVFTAGGDDWPAVVGSL